MFAYVPARGGSKRIPRKNLRPLGGKPLLLHVLDALADVPGLTGIGVSSEDEEILAVAQKHPRVKTLAPRDRALSDDTTGFLDLVRHDVPRFAREFGDEDVLFVTATAALVRPEHFQTALERHREAPSGLTMAVTEYSSSPMLALVGEPGSSLTPLFPESYLKPTASLPSAFVDAGCFYAFSLSRTAGITKLLDLAPVRGVVLPPGVGIDVDTPADWGRLEDAYGRLRSGQSRPGGPAAG